MRQTGGGLSAQPRSHSLYTQDTSAHYAQYSVAQIFSDPTPANNGFWLKTGTGNGSGNWTQQSTITLASLNAAIVTETGRAESKEAYIQATTPTATGIWADDTPFAIAFTDLNGNVLDGSIYIGGARYTTNLNALAINALWADETYGLYAITDSNGNLIEGQTTAGAVWPPAQLATADRTALNLWEGIAGLQLWSDENYGIPFTDPSGNVILGVRKDGSVDIPNLNVTTSALTATDAAAMSFFEATYIRMWDEIYGFTITDGNNNVLFGIEHNGSVDIPGLNPSEDTWLPFIDTPGSLGRAGSLWANNGMSVFRIAYPQGSGVIAPPPWLVGQSVKWSDLGVSPPELREYFFNAETGVVPSTITIFIHIPLTGEFTSVGTDAGTLYTTSPISTTNAFMFNGGTRLLGIASYAFAELNVKAPDATQVTLQPLVEVDVNGWGETQLSGCAKSVLNIEPLPSTTAILGSAHGIAGTVISQLGQGSQPYENFFVLLNAGMPLRRRTARRSRCLASCTCRASITPLHLRRLGIRRSRRCSRTSLATSTTSLAALRKFRFSSCSTACWTASAGSDQAPAPAMCQGMIDVYNANSGKIFLVGNSYHLPWFAADGVHMLARGYRMQGEEIGRAIAEYLAGGTGSVTPPLFAMAATASHGSSSLTVTFNNTTLLDIDTSIVSDPGQYGLRLTDSGGNPIALSSITVVGTGANAQITATTASALTIGGTYNLGIANYGTAGANAGPTTGPRSCIRDSAPESYSMGGRMYRYACTQSIPVTVGA